MMATNILRVSCKSTKPESQWSDSSFDGKILAHHAKLGYDYPIIRLPFTFSGLIGLPTRIYQTVHDGALAFLVVVSPMSKRSSDKHENAIVSAVPPVFTRRGLGVRISSSPLPFSILRLESCRMMSTTRMKSCTTHALTLARETRPLEKRKKIPTLGMAQPARLTQRPEARMGLCAWQTSC